MTTSTPRWIAPSCGPLGAPPYTHLHAHTPVKLADEQAVHSREPADTRRGTNALITQLVAVGEPDRAAAGHGLQQTGGKHCTESATALTARKGVPENAGTVSGQALQCARGRV
jgi:hypothetical protein